MFHFKGDVSRHAQQRCARDPSRAQTSFDPRITPCTGNTLIAEPWPVWIDGAPQPPPPPAAAGTLRVTYINHYINHATLLVQVDGLNILTDPIFSERASPVSWAGPRRVRPPGVRFDDLPAIDVVLVSHNHYDHLDRPTLARLAARDAPVILVGLGNSRLLTQAGIAGGHDLDWWESVKVGPGVRATFVPAAHFSGRGVGDHDQTLWGGFVVESSRGPIYFAGDTGMGEHFAELRQRFGPMTVAMLPIGAFAPRWFMHPVHIAPDEAVRAHQLLQAGISVAMHFGTFPLGDDAIDEPARALADGLADAGEDPSRFWLLDFGEGRAVTPSPPNIWSWDAAEGAPTGRPPAAAISPNNEVGFVYDRCRSDPPSDDEQRRLGLLGAVFGCWGGQRSRPAMLAASTAQSGIDHVPG